MKHGDVPQQPVHVWSQPGFASHVLQLHASLLVSGGLSCAAGHGAHGLGPVLRHAGQRVVLRGPISSRRGALGAPQAPYSWLQRAGCRHASFACVPVSSALRKTGGLAEDSPGFDTQNCCSRGSAPAVVCADRLQCRRSRNTAAAAVHARRATHSRSRGTCAAVAHACRRTRRRSHGTDTAAARAGTSSQAGAQVPSLNTLGVFLHVPASGDANERARIEAAV